MKTSLFLALLLLPLAGGCSSSGNSSGGAAMQGSIFDGVYVTHLQQDVKKVWPVAKTVISDASLQLVEIDETIKMVKGEIDGATVTVNVEPYDVDKSTLSVRARKYGLYDNSLSEIISERIVRRLGGQ